MPSFPPSLEHPKLERGRARGATPFCPSIPFVNRQFARSLSLLFLNRSFGCPFGRGRHFGSGSHREFWRPTLLNSRNLGHILCRGHIAQCVKLALRRETVCRIMRRRLQPLEPLEVGRRLAAHSGTTLVIFKAIITIILHFGGLPDIL